MSLQTIKAGLWEVQLPVDWVYRHQGIEKTTYFEAPDQTQGVYLSTWRSTSKTLLAAMVRARALEGQNLPTAGEGTWEVLHSFESEGESYTEVRAEYFNRVAAYRIVSLVLGRGGSFVRLTYHDRGCTDLRLSTERSEPWIRSLCFRSSSAK